MTDLDKLIEAVEAGLSSPTNWRNFAALTGATADGKPLSILAHRAYYGSLDAAKRLHDALLPNMYWDVWRTTTFDDDPRCFGCNLPGMDTAYSTTPARAWLLAILLALKPKGGAE